MQINRWGFICNNLFLLIIHYFLFSSSSYEIMPNYCRHWYVYFEIWKCLFLNTAGRNSVTQLTLEYKPSRYLIWIMCQCQPRHASDSGVLEVGAPGNDPALIRPYYCPPPPRFLVPRYNSPPPQNFRHSDIPVVMKKKDGDVRFKHFLKSYLAFLQLSMYLTYYISSSWIGWFKNSLFFLPTFLI